MIEYIVDYTTFKDLCKISKTCERLNTLGADVFRRKYSRIILTFEPKKERRPQKKWNVKITQFGDHGTNLKYTTF